MNVVKRFFWVLGAYQPTGSELAVLHLEMTQDRITRAQHDVLVYSGIIEERRATLGLLMEREKRLKKQVKEFTAQEAPVPDPVVS